MFEKSLGLKEPWKVTKAQFIEENRSVHVYVEADKNADSHSRMSQMD